MVDSVSSAQCHASYGAQGMQGAQGKQALQEKLFSKLDADGNGSIDKSELNDFMSFVASAQGTQATDSSQLFSKLDTDGDGAVSQSELADGARSLFQELRSQMMTTSSNTSQPPDTASAAPAPAEGGHRGHGLHGGGLFAKLDSLLDQYRATASTDSSNTDALSIAA